MKISTLLGIMLVAFVGNVLAVPVYSLANRPDDYGGSPTFNVGPTNTPIDYDYPRQQTYLHDANSGEVHANVNTGSIGIMAGAYNDGRYAPARQEVTGRFGFDVIFGSAGTDPINVIMNLDLSGDINKPATAGIYSTIQVNAGVVGGAVSAGSYGESSSSPTFSEFMLAGFIADGSEQTVHTGSLTVPVNTLVSMFFSLKTIQAYDNSEIFFGNTFNLTTTGDVFTIAGGGDITVNSVDAGIVNNRFGAGIPSPDNGTIPEPSALLLFATGLLGFRIVRK